MCLLNVLQLDINIMNSWFYVNLTVECSFMFTFVLFKGESICSIIFKINNAFFTVTPSRGVSRIFSTFDRLIGAGSGGAVPSHWQIMHIVQCFKIC